MIRVHRSLVATVAAVILLSAAVPLGPDGGIDVAGMDTSVRPGDNFFLFTNGTWIRDTPIPPDRGSYGAGAIVADLTDKRVVDLIQSAAKASAPVGSTQRMIGDYYASFMDTTAIEAAGITPLQPAFVRIAAIKTRTDLARVLGSTLQADVDALNATNFFTENIFGLWVASDLDRPTKYSPFLLQGGLGMPDRSYYTDSSGGMAAIRARYQAHIAALLTLAGIAGADTKAAAIMQLEMKIAEAHWTREQSGDVARANNHWSRKDFQTKAPGLEWETYFAAAQLGKPAEFVVWQPSAVTGISALVASQPIETWKDYLTFHAIQSRGGVLPRAYSLENFAFFGTVLSGTPKQRERWKRGVNFTNNALGYAVGKLYAEKYFPAADKARVQQLVANLIVAFGVRIDSLAWMDAATKTEAKAKLAVLKVGVGYPDTWPEYAGLKVVANDAYGNAERSDAYEYQRNLKLLGQPVNRSQWVMTPQTVNAVNLPALNAMNFPAAILQSPYFDASRPESMDYGAIGSVIGHEISHSFDSQGAQFDAEGKLRNWWTPDDLKHFEASSKQLIAQYDAYKPFPDLAVNGAQTLNENIADVAGLATALDAYHVSLHGKDAPMVQGFTGDQQFFIAFGQSWREKQREQVLRRGILTDGHAPDEYRTFTVRNIDAWYPAFNVQPGEALYLAPADRVKVW